MAVLFRAHMNDLSKPVSPIRNPLANSLRSIRTELKWTPEKAAELSKGRVTARYIRNLEKARSSPTVDLLYALLRVYGITLEEFFASIQIPNKRRTA